MLLPPVAARHELIQEYEELHSYHRVAAAHRVNVVYIYHFLKFGKVPSSASIRRRMGIRQAYNYKRELLKPVSEMDPEALKFAIENREEIQ